MLAIKYKFHAVTVCISNRVMALPAEGKEIVEILCQAGITLCMCVCVLVI